MRVTATRRDVLSPRQRFSGCWAQTDWCPGPNVGEAVVPLSGSGGVRRTRTDVNLPRQCKGDPDILAPARGGKWSEKERRCRSRQVHLPWQAT